MSWYSVHGTGFTLHGIQAQDDGRVEFTSWISVLWVPILPIRSYSALYAGERPPDGITDEAHCFVDLRRIPHNWSRIVWTWLVNMLSIVVGVAPAGFLIMRTQGRAATTLEMVLLLLAAVWPVALLIMAERHRRRRLRGEE